MTQTFATPPRERIIHNLAAVQARIAAAAQRAGRDPSDVTLVAVTKTAGLDAIEILHAAGVRHFGENRLHLAEDKIRKFTRDAEWHMIGAIQRRKIPRVLELFTRIDAVDRMPLAESLQRHAEETGRHVRCLLEVNVSGEASKHGFPPPKLEQALEAIRELDALDVEGLMTMAPLTDNPEDTRPVFAALRSLARDLGLPALSMGMSNDFEIAIEEGATEVRIGAALFEDSRNHAN